METVTRAADRGLSIASASTRAIRITMVSVWVMYVISSISAGMTVTDPWVWVPFAAALASALLGTRPDARYTRGDAWLTLLCTTVASTVIFSYSEPSHDLWMYFFSAYLAAAQVLRGDLRAGLTAGGVVIAIGASWVTLHGGSAGDYLAVLLVPLLGIGLFAFLNRGLVRYVREELAYQMAAERSRLEAQAASDAITRSNRDLAEVARICGPLLAHLAAGRPVDDETRSELGVVEATVRESIRSPLLQHPVLDRAVLRARRRGVAVLRLGEAMGGEPARSIRGTVAQAIATRLDALGEGDVVTIRVLPDHTGPASVSLLVRTAEQSVRTVFRANDEARSYPEWAPAAEG